MIETREDKSEEATKEYDHNGMTETYHVKEQLSSLGNVFWIEAGVGRKAYRVDSRLYGGSVRLGFADAQGHEEAFVESASHAMPGKLRIERLNGSGALLQKDLINIVRDQFILSFDNGDELEIHGNFPDHEYQFDRGRDRVAEVSKRWFHNADSYGLLVQAGEDDVMFLAAAVALDQSSHDAGLIDL